MDREIVSTEHAPAAVGPYSQGIRVGQFVFTAGQIALDPASGQLLEADIAGQTRQVFSNLRAVLEAAGTSLDNVVKTTVFLSDIGLFGAMNEVYAEQFGDNRPARSTVAVSLPMGALVEIEVIALMPSNFALL